MIFHISFVVFAQQEGDLRLTGFGASQVSGRLELFLNNQWSTICINGFTKKDADTACRQFGGDKAVEYGDTNKLGYVTVSSIVQYDVGLHNMTAV